MLDNPNGAVSRTILLKCFKSILDFCLELLPTNLHLHGTTSGGGGHLELL